MRNDGSLLGFIQFGRETNKQNAKQSKVIRICVDTSILVLSLPQSKEEPHNWKMTFTKTLNVAKI